MELTDLITRARRSEARALGRLISLVENESPQSREIDAELAPHTGSAHIVGLTGPPGVGKSTSVTALVSELRRRGRTVAVLAIDPSSPYTGGALLGDRVRMQSHSTDPGVYIRSMASRGSLGGLSATATASLRVLDGIGFDVILVETVGVGQSEVDISAVADTTIVLLAPGMGDEVQASKAGVLEVGDIFIVNKADQGGAESTRRQLRFMIGGNDHDASTWLPPVTLAVALSSKGFGDIVDAIDSHRIHLTASGELERRRTRRARREIEELTMQLIRARLHAGPHLAKLDALASDVVSGSTDPYSAAVELAGQ
ncbi:methylmalonyl Co-A mutase-associated GTPase MeaB [Rhodococcus oxybenzonivorans]|uniref:Methylmalonyl Co-A mutase-associated GTPase MeaB n=1 Tax=Rhodococcus oxybenzonivorans TaxID=1990687 RepID=A0A2S2BZ99_9NOCA|nr:methylmalonyl Co-A mutase-associated GTPase MeaB [Rhodococcus oxybenzonivorans]AWK73884.1 methylmalonyl Co-A mutase-associated GTPase MeaB [Rhodococcus oxybenzonivorans]